MPVEGFTKLSYGSYFFKPAPLFSWTKELVRDSKFDQLYIQNTLEFNGTLLENSPSESGSFVLMNQKRQSLQDALLASGVQPLIITYQGDVVISGIFPKVSNVTIDQGVWVDRVNYSFTAQFNEELDPSGAIQQFSETWDFQENEDRRSITATHNISAVGIDTSNGGTNNSLTNARTFVLSKLGYTNVPPGHPAFAQGSGTLLAYEELRSESVDVQAGSFAVSEAFTLSSGNYIHTRTSDFDIDNTGITTISLNGTVRGLGRGDVAFVRAFNGWTNNIRPKLPADASGIYSQCGGSATLYTSNFQSFRLTKNSFAGTIDYSATYSDDPSTDLPSGIQEFTFNIQDQKPVKLFASFTIPQRSLGNVVQDIATPTEGRFSINGTAIGKQGFPFDDIIVFVEDKINDNRPLAANYQTLRLDSQTITKDEQKNTLTFSLLWVYTTDLSLAKIDGPVILD